jgi:hypothetical protein
MDILKNVVVEFNLNRQIVPLDISRDKGKKKWKKALNLASGNGSQIQRQETWKGQLLV